ncbi:MAG: (d)CMP kinase [Candidatus Obscuribacterales bacterium]|nr:(d)CMP kinase [Steroidobacteraceae bacterium]
MITPVIAIDGPSGSGKGTIARLVAEQLGWHLLDSGALYRLVGLAALNKGISTSDHAACGQLAAALNVRFGSDAGGHEQIWLAGEEVSATLRTESAGDRASQVAAIPAVRAALFERQRRFAEPPGLVADGRDMGTVVFQDALLKIYLTASAEERAKRRHKQLKDKGIDVSLAALSREVADRDHRDLTRAIAPLKPAADAVTIDSTSMPIDAVVEQVLAAYASKVSQPD